MPHLTNKNSFKIKDLPFLWHWWQVLASVLARKNCLKSIRCHKWHAWRTEKWRGVDLSQQEKKKADAKECKWNVNKPYRIVNQKVEKLAKRHDKRQFTHSSIASYYIYIYLYYILYYLIKSNIFSPAFCCFPAALMLLCATSC